VLNGIKIKEVRGWWVKFHIEVFDKLYFPPNMLAARRLTVRQVRLRIHVTCRSEMTNLYNIVVGKHERKVQLAIFRHRRVRECNIEMDVKR
jgi:hypothetical protein